mmetsp:Transcript_2695/g.9028  ORF Transcript_2695/g.9028 Transcript_2695/m.9028 type:complete len:221 (-) Transcript_2695:180-842(-)
MGGGWGRNRQYPFWDFPVGTHFGRLDSLSRAWDAACRRQPPPSSSSWSARDRPWPRRRRPTRPRPDPRQGRSAVRRPARPRSRWVMRSCARKLRASRGSSSTPMRRRTGALSKSAWSSRTVTCTALPSVTGSTSVVRLMSCCKIPLRSPTGRKRPPRPLSCGPRRRKTPFALRLARPARHRTRPHRPMRTTSAMWLSSESCVLGVQGVLVCSSRCEGPSG